MPGDHPPSRTPGQVITTSLTGGLGNGGPDAAHAQANWLIPSHVAEVADALLAQDHKGVNSDGHDTKLIATYVKAKRAQTVDDDETWDTNRPAPSLNAFDNGHETRATVLAFGWQENHHAGETHTEQTTALTTTKTQAIHSQQHGVRRLTPIECERLMGWPDNWTAHTNTGPQADSHRYRQCGNGVVANITHWIGQRLHPATGSHGENRHGEKD